MPIPSLRHMAAMAWHDQHRALRQTHELLRRAAQKCVPQTCIAVRRGDHHVHVRPRTCLGKLVYRRANRDLRLGTNPDQRQKPSSHPTCLPHEKLSIDEAASRSRSGSFHSHVVGRVDDVNRQKIGTDSCRKDGGVFCAFLRALGEINWHENFFQDDAFSPCLERSASCLTHDQHRTRRVTNNLLGRATECEPFETAVAYVAMTIRSASSSCAVAIIS